MAPYRAPGRSNRSGRTNTDNDVFEGLPVKQWSQSYSRVSMAPPVQEVATVVDDKWGDPPMPRDYQLLSPWTQQLLRLARSGKVGTKRKADHDTTEDDNTNVKPEDEAAEDANSKPQHPQEDRGYVARRWKHVPEQQLAPEHKHFEFLAKRRRGLPHLDGSGEYGGPPVIMRKTQVQKTNANGETAIYEVLVPEGQVIEGEVLAPVVDVPVQAALAPGTVIEGVGVANEEGIVVAEHLRPAAARRNRPPPKKKGGPGRGKKRVTFTNPDGSTYTTIVPNATKIVPAPGQTVKHIAKGEEAAADITAEQAAAAAAAETGEGGEDDDDGEDGEDDDDEDGEDDDDDDREEGELSDDEAQTSAPPPPAASIAPPAAAAASDAPPAEAIPASAAAVISDPPAQADAIGPVEQPAKEDVVMGEDEEDGYSPPADIPSISADITMTEAPDAAAPEPAAPLLDAAQSEIQIGAASETVATGAVVAAVTQAEVPAVEPKAESVTVETESTMKPPITQEEGLVAITASTEAVPPASTLANAAVPPLTTDVVADATTAAAPVEFEVPGSAISAGQPLPELTSTIIPVVDQTGATTAPAAESAPETSSALPVGLEEPPAAAAAAAAAAATESTLEEPTTSNGGASLIDSAPLSEEIASAPAAAGAEAPEPAAAPTTTTTEPPAPSAPEEGEEDLLGDLEKHLGE